MKHILQLKLCHFHANTKPFPELQMHRYCHHWESDILRYISTKSIQYGTMVLFTNFRSWHIINKNFEKKNFRTTYCSTHLHWPMYTSWGPIPHSHFLLSHWGGVSRLPDPQSLQPPPLPQCAHIQSTRQAFLKMQPITTWNPEWDYITSHCWKIMKKKL